MHITLINDCKDDNAKGRQLTRIGALVPNASLSFIGVGGYADLEAAGNLIDALDAIGDAEGVILVNVAPRHKGSKRWPNGTPFGYFKYRNTHVLASIDGHTLSLAKKFNLFETVALFDIAKTAPKIAEAGIAGERDAEQIAASQFRSFDFLPRAAALILSGGEAMYSETISKDDIPDAPKAVWWVDNFGNAKTTIFPEEINFVEGTRIETDMGRLQCVTHLSELPNGESGLVVGSSGLGEQRFVEVMTQGGRAADTLSLLPGSRIIA